MRRDKEKEKVLTVAQEIHFAKALAANDKQLRERALRRLHKWLCLKSKSNTEFTEEGFMRIWKGLFYCVWMSDKPLIQESTVESISHLVHCFNKFEDSLMFMRCFYQAMSQAWFGLDQHRLDKYMMLVRRFVRQGFVVLKKENWKEEAVREVADMFFQALSIAPVGFIMHLADVYIVELSKIGEGDLSSEVVVGLVKPWAKLLTTQADMRIIGAIKKYIFLYLIRQTDLALKHEAKYEVWKNRGFPGGHIDCMEELSSDSEMDISTDEEGAAPGSSDEDEDVFLDPRAGSADTVLPPVDFKPSDIINLLHTTKISHQRTLIARQSKSISLLIDKFKQLEKNKYPLGIHRVELPKDESSDEDLDNAIDRLSKFQRDTYLASDSRLKKRKMLQDDSLFDRDVGCSIWDVSESNGEDETASKGINLILSPHSLASSPWTVNEIGKGKEKEGASRPKKRKLSGGLSNGLETPLSNSSMKQVNNENNDMARTSEASIENGEVVIDIPINRVNTPANNKHTPKPSASKKFLTPASEKKVLFALSKNRAQEAEEYVKTVEKSPMIPYDASKKPRQGVLKASALASPIDPFYMKRMKRNIRKTSL